MLKTYAGSCHCGGVRRFGIGTETPIGRMYGGKLGGREVV